MNDNNKKSLLIYLSPHGTTQKSMEAVAEGLKESGFSTDLINIKNYINSSNSDEDDLYKNFFNYKLLIFGTPTYAHHPVPVFNNLIKNLPNAADGQSIALLQTFGGVSSGMALFDMAKIIKSKGYNLIGGMKVLTEHCLMFQGKNPLYRDYPISSALELLREFGRKLSIRAQQCDINLSEIDFINKPFSLRLLDRTIINMASLKPFLPNPKILKAHCTACGTCVKACPVNNIQIENEAAFFLNSCIKCYCCVKVCPAKAVRAGLKPLEPIVRLFARIFGKKESMKTEQIV